tara:strand:+ start:19784 stop:20401 length:618 start_codon:yes stop_codon:yes gene_type:complete
MQVSIRNVRLSFNDLFTAKSVNGGALKFAGTFICSDDTEITYTNDKGEKIVTGHAGLKDVCALVAADKFGKAPSKINNWAYNKADGSTTRDVYTNSDGEFWAGFNEDTWYISAGKLESMCKDGKMKVIDQRCDDLEASDGLIHSGCYVKVFIDVYAYDGGSGKGLTAALEGVQLLRKGEPLGFTPINIDKAFEVEEIEAEEDSVF